MSWSNKNIFHLFHSGVPVSQQRRVKNQPLPPPASFFRGKGQQRLDYTTSPVSNKRVRKGQLLVQVRSQLDLLEAAASPLEVSSFCITVTAPPTGAPTHKQLLSSPSLPLTLSIDVQARRTASTQGEDLSRITS